MTWDGVHADQGRTTSATTIGHVLDPHHYSPANSCSKPPSLCLANMPAGAHWQHASNPPYPADEAQPPNGSVALEARPGRCERAPMLPRPPHMKGGDLVLAPRR
jgi:hypothetical protein